ncbi:uncharacterized protein (DUF427 family) [Kitasatospora sp. SolWspMP-SS2h]|uniref:DUF427 domain-containing protein n=1 Tax=Kitasatospora sp. SolWspMP-SS2h TaxID=1305729 RepID=UPI000DC042DA|nr:DUF427 domain-containing protein [Kitasatospora sp. SolWspMP-SS2h]RAJ45413.1 uncharacterized protein (DUF427 family) [Kitasatospora sp. SolWspMP-SS2h]
MRHEDRPTESVWDYPRPPAVVPDGRLVEVFFAGRLLASTRRALRVLETSHPPVFYLPRPDVATALLRPADGGTLCEWKGRARYWNALADGRLSPRAAWSYPEPLPGYRALRDHLAFHPDRVERCTVDGETVRPQQGGFYGGWITDEITGPFKGAPGTSQW